MLPKTLDLPLARDRFVEGGGAQARVASGASIELPFLVLIGGEYRYRLFDPERGKVKNRVQLRMEHTIIGGFRAQPILKSFRSPKCLPVIAQGIGVKKIQQEWLPIFKVEQQLGNILGVQKRWYP